MSALTSNQPHPESSIRAISSYEQVVERRGAELIIRLASNIQYMKDCLQIINQIDATNFINCNENFVDEVDFLVNSMFGSSFVELNNSVEQYIKERPNMKITKETCQESVHIFFHVLMPQHFSLMNYRTRLQGSETKSEIFYQTKILKFNYRIFYKTTLYGNSGVLKNLDKDFVEHLLSRLIRRGLLKHGTFVHTEKSSVVYESYLKPLPLNEMEKKRFIIELSKHGIAWEQYFEIYKTSHVSPYGTVLTNDGLYAMQENDRVIADPNVLTTLSTPRTLTPNSSNNGRNSQKIMKKQPLFMFLFYLRFFCLVHRSINPYLPSSKDSDNNQAVVNFDNSSEYSWNMSD